MITASVTIKIQFYHLDPMKVVWHGNYMHFFEQARCDLLDKIDYNYLQMIESGFLWPIVDMRIKYICPLQFAQSILVTATIVEFENRLKIKYLITDHKTGAKLTEGFTIQVAVDAVTEKMCFETPQVFQIKVKALL
jgi:acyl-CoA thioester hydrolase